MMLELKLRSIDRSPVDRASQRRQRRRHGDGCVIAVVHENSSAALRGDREKTGEQTKKASKRRECLIPGAFIISHRVAEKKSEKEAAGRERRGDEYIRGSAVYDYRRCYIYIYIFF